MIFFQFFLNKSTIILKNKIEWIKFRKFTQLQCMGRKSVSVENTKLPQDCYKESEKITGNLSLIYFRKFFF